MIILTTTLSEFITIFKNLMHLLENHNSIFIHPAKCGRSTQCVVQGTRHTLHKLFSMQCEAPAYIHQTLEDSMILLNWQKHIKNNESQTIY